MSGKISTDLIRGHTDTIILNILRQGDSYGYEIYKKIIALSGKKYELKEATLYTAFRRLEQDELIVSYWGMNPREEDASITGLPRRARRYTKNT
jgi:PadR family transcriptional regulator PadR